MSTPEELGDVVDHIKELEDYMAELSEAEELEQVVSEIGALHSIYGDDSIRVWKAVPAQNAEHVATVSRMIRYEIHVDMLPPYDVLDSKLRILVSLPATYPKSNAPQLQLLSRYIGPYKMDSTLFGSVLRTFISRDGVEWQPDNVCVFDGIENVRERCAAWYGERLSEKAAEQLRAADETGQAHNINSLDSSNEGISGPSRRNATVDVAVELPPGISIIETEPYIDRKSVFIGRACSITDPSQVSLVLSYLLADRRIARATHPVINAWRCRVGDVVHQDNDDDGESAAGARLAHLLQILDLDNVLVIVTRFYGGVQLGPDRFKHINHVARKALEVGGFLDAPEPPSGRKAQARHKRH